MKAKEILLLILIIAAGVIFYHAQTGQIHIDLGEGIFFGVEEFIYEDSQVIAPPFPVEIHILNSHGDVDIQGEDVPEITVSLRKEIWRRTEEQADEINARLEMTIDRDAGRLSLRTNREEFNKRNFNTHFEISIPKDMAVRIENSYGLVKVTHVGDTRINNRHGEVGVFNVKGQIEIENSYKDISVEQATSDCRITSRHNDVSLKAIGGEIRVSHRYGRVLLEDIEGKVMIQGSHSEVFGWSFKSHCYIESSYEDITLENIGSADIEARRCQVEVKGSRGDVSISDSHGRVILSDIAGRLEIEGKNLRVDGENLLGDELRITTSYQPVEISGFSGKTFISASNGRVQLRPSSLKGPLEVKGRYSDILLYWPSGEEYPVEARVRNGDIFWELSSPPSHESTNGESLAKAFTDRTDRPTIVLNTAYGHIRITE